MYTPAAGSTGYIKGYYADIEHIQNHQEPSFSDMLKLHQKNYLTEASEERT